VPDPTDHAKRSIRWPEHAKGHTGLGRSCRWNISASACVTMRTGSSPTEGDVPRPVLNNKPLAATAYEWQGVVDGQKAAALSERLGRAVQ
jgi:hypothetical protein